jgi:dihydropteroate synthase
MGILNVTPDSFSDGGRHFRMEDAVERALTMVKEGADIIDVGGESTRPGAEEISTDTELQRVIPVIRALSEKTDITISVDTMKAVVAREAVAAGARIINDVSALTFDDAMAETAAATGAGVILMHMQGLPRTMQSNPRYDDVVADVNGYLEKRVQNVIDKGVARESLAVDPGIGFGKTVEHNLLLLAGLEVFGQQGLPVAVGLSRKSFLGKLTGRDVDDRLAGSLAALVFSILNGADIMRVHDIRESHDAVRIAGLLEERRKVR